MVGWFYVLPASTRATRIKACEENVSEPKAHQIMSVSMLLAHTYVKLWTLAATNVSKILLPSFYHEAPHNSNWCQLAGPPKKQATSTPPSKKIFWEGLSGSSCSFSWQRYFLTSPYSRKSTPHPSARQPEAQSHLVPWAGSKCHASQAEADSTCTKPGCPGMMWDGGFILCFVKKNHWRRKRRSGICKECEVETCCEVVKREFYVWFMTFCCLGPSKEILRGPSKARERQRAQTSQTDLLTAADVIRSIATKFCMDLASNHVSTNASTT